MSSKLFLAAGLLCFSALVTSAQQVPSTPVSPNRPPQIRVEPARPGDIRVVNFQPDLVVKEMRIEGDKAVRVLIANIGTATAGGFYVESVAYTDSVVYKDKMNAHKLVRIRLPELGVGEEKWLTFASPFKAVIGLPSAPGNPATVDLLISYVKYFSVRLDVHQHSALTEGPLPAQRPKGDVIERDESNNFLKVAMSEMKPWVEP